MAKPLSEFHRHPFASFGRKPSCKPCASNYGKARYRKKLANAGLSIKPVLGGTVVECNRKKGDIREDGMVFFSRRKVQGGYREWWMPINEFHRRRLRQNELVNLKYRNNSSFREELRVKNTSEESRKRKRDWNKRNRHVIESYLAGRRAKIKGNFSVLTDSEKKAAQLFYKFRDILNLQHGNPVFEVDHIRAIARGGLHHPNNLQITTGSYNRRKFVNDTPRSERTGCY